MSVVPSASRSIDARGGEAYGLSPTSPLRIATPPSVGDWPCACGQVYRVLAEPLTFWAQNSRYGFRVDPTVACVSCGADLEDAFALEAAHFVSAWLLRD
jgi:hypothetical protein